MKLDGIGKQKKLCCRLPQGNRAMPKLSLRFKVRLGVDHDVVVYTYRKHYANQPWNYFRCITTYLITLQCHEHKLFLKNSNLCDHDTSTSRTDGQTDNLM